MLNKSSGRTSSSLRINDLRRHLPSFDIGSKPILNSQGQYWIESGGAGITFSASRGGAITNNRFLRNTVGVWGAAGASNLSVSGNIITGSFGAGIAIGGQGGADFGFTISANTITGGGITGFPGIAVVNAGAGAASNTITGNTVSGNLDGIKIEGGLSRNWTISGNSANGTASGSSFVQKTGIWILAPAAGITVKSNNCVGNSIAPLMLTGNPGVTVSSNAGCPVRN